MPTDDLTDHEHCVERRQCWQENYPCPALRDEARIQAIERGAAIMAGTPEGDRLAALAAEERSNHPSNHPAQPPTGTAEAVSRAMSDSLLEPLRPWAVSGFNGLWPVGTAAIVYARNREHCKRVLLRKLQSEGSSLHLVRQSPDHWTIEPLPPVDREFAHVLCDGDY